MLIIFQPDLNKNPRGSWPLVLLIFTFITCIAAQKQTELKYATAWTKCIITLTTSHSQANLTQQQAGRMRFKSCEMRRCASLGSGSDCRENTTIGLEESDCFWSCCRTRYFDEQECQQNNLYLQAQSQKMDQYLICVLAACSLLLLLIILYFVVYNIKCFEKKAPMPEKEVPPIWKQAKYEDHKCNVCEQYGAVIETYCRHYFHIQCFKQATINRQITGQCLTCDQISKRYRFWCSQCHEKYIKIGYSEMKTFQQLELYYRESLVLHDDCMKDIFAYAKTDLRLTSTTSQ